MKVVGTSIPHESAVGHVTGQAFYIDDLPKLENEIHTDFLGSPFAHGKIKSIHLNGADKIEGVLGIFTYKDIDGKNQFGPIFQDEFFLAESYTHFLHEPIVVIAGETKRAIEKAKKLISIEMEELEPVFTIEEAIAKNQFIGPERVITRGDLQKGFHEAEHILEGTFYSGGQEQFYLESQIAYAIPGEGKQLTIYSSTQNPTEIQTVVAGVLGLNQSDVVCICKRMGGGFGGKETQGAHPALIASLVALKIKRPVRFGYNKDLDMKITGKRHPYRTTYKVGFDQNGLIKGIQFQFHSNGGASADLSTSVLERTMLHSDSAYYLENVFINARVCKTNLPPNTAFRGFGGPQGSLVMENIIEEIGIFLHKDPYDVRILNCYGKETRNTTPYGQIIRNNVLPEMFEQIYKTSNYLTRTKEIEKFNQSSETHLKGISLTPVKFGISFTSKFLNQANALVNVYTDGTIQVSTGGTEMGQGLNTKIQQLVAEEFQVGPEMVQVMQTSTEKNNNASPTAASAGTDLNGSAAVVACRKIKDNLKEFAATHLASIDKGIEKSPEHIVFKDGIIFDNRIPENKISFKELVILAYKNRVNLGERGFYKTPGVDYNRDTGKGNPFHYFTNCMAVTEVLLDRFTGEVKILQMDTLFDFGKSINPAIDKGQAIGGVVQGIGWATTEELIYTIKGQLLSHSPTTYKIPNIQDFPEVFNFEFFKNESNTTNVGSSKAVAEPPLLVGISVFCAIKNALSYINKTIPKLSLPATSEEVLRRIEEENKKSKSYANGYSKKFKNEGIVSIKDKELALIH